MTKFKTGDSIICTEVGGNEALTYGKAYTVVSDSSLDMVNIVNDNGKKHEYYNFRFMLNETTPQDIVMVTEDEFIAAYESIDKGMETVLAYLDGLNKRLEPHGISLVLSPTTKE